MDTHSTEFPLSETEALRRLVDQVLVGGDAVLTFAGSGGQDVMDQAAPGLQALGFRVLRASADAPGGLSLSGLMAQVTDEPDLAGHDDEVLERGFQALTVPGDGCTGIVLMVGGAQALQRTALRYLQFACRAGKSLKLVLGGEDTPDLMGDELSALRTRLSAHPVIPVASTAMPAPCPEPHPAIADGQAAAPVAQPALRPILSSPASLSPRPPASRAAVWAGLALAMAGSTAFGVWIGRHEQPGTPAVQATQPTPPDGQPAAQASIPAPTGPGAAGVAPLAQPTPAASLPPPQPAPAATATEGPAPSRSPAPPRRSAARRSPPPALQAQPAARLPGPGDRSSVDWDAPLPTPLQDARPWRAARPNPRPDRTWDAPPHDALTQYAPTWDMPPWGVARPTIGTYTTGADGVRTFRSGP